MHDPRAKQAMYMQSGGRTSPHYRIVFWLSRLVIPIMIGLGVLWALI